MEQEQDGGVLGSGLAVEDLAPVGDGDLCHFGHDGEERGGEWEEAKEPSEDRSF